METEGFFRKYALYLAWIVSLIATGGSLYMSDILLYEPCKLCWLQRIFMYPQVVLLAIASYRNDRRIIPYIIPLCAIGGSISIYHYLQQKIPAFAKVVPCSSGIPCNYDYLNWFGFITIPLLALIAFIMIITLLWIGREQAVEAVDEEEQDLTSN